MTGFGLLLAALSGLPFVIRNGTDEIPVTAVAGVCARVSPCGTGVQLEVVDPKPDKWPAVYFTFDGYRNLDDVGEVRVRVRNPKTDEVQKVGLKVKAVTQQGQTPGTMKGVRSGVVVLRLPLKIEQYVFDRDPHLKGLKRHPKVVGGTSYTLDRVTSVSVFLEPMSEGGCIAVESVELVPAMGKVGATVLKADELNPWVDEFGQARFADFPAKIRSVEDLKARCRAERAELDARPQAISEADEFGGWKGGPQLPATGHFRTEKVKGRWWLVDPAGRLFFAQGLNCGWDLTPTAVQYREEYFEKLPPREGATAQFWSRIKSVAYRNYYSDPARVPYWAFSFQRYNLWRKHGECDDYLRRNDELMAKRCRAWGVNCLTGASKALRAVSKIPYHVSLGPQSRKIASVRGYWGEMLDPYAPEFASNCVRQAEWLKESRDDPYCIGCTVHNELSWGRNGATLAKSVLAAPDDQPAKVALLALLAERGKSVETASETDLRALGQTFAEKYYSTVRSAIKAVAPEMLYLGDRNDKRNPEVFKAAAKYCDVVTVNVYDYQASVELPPGAEDKPLWVTEFHFGCYDTGYFYASLLPVADQERRAQCYRDYLASVIDSPRYVGANWFCWRDQPITGVIGESANSSCGVVSVTDVPYRELTGAMKAVAAEMYGRRCGKRLGAATFRQNPNDSKCKTEGWKQDLSAAKPSKWTLEGGLQ